MLTEPLCIFQWDTHIISDHPRTAVRHLRISIDLYSDRDLLTEAQPLGIFYMGLGIGL